MSIKTLSSREFNQDVSKAKRIALEGPVFITDRGRPAHVLLSIAHYEQISGQEPSIVESLAMPADSDIEFDPPELGEMSRPADFS